MGYMIFAIVQVAFSLAASIVLLAHFTIVERKVRSLILALVSFFLVTEGVLKWLSASNVIKLSVISNPLDGPITVALVSLLFAFVIVDSIFRLIELIIELRRRANEKRKD